MGFRLSYRPGFSVRRFFHHLREDVRVWKLNREVADAFHDDLLDGPVLADRVKVMVPEPAVAARWARRSRLLIIPAALALLAAGGAWLALRGKPDRLGSSPSLPDAAALTDIPSAPLPATGAPVPPSAAPDGQSAGLALDTAAGVNMAIMLAAAGLDAEPEAATAAPSVPVRMPDRYHALIASKKDRTLFVYAREGQGRWKKAASFPMAYGRWEGDKDAAGDRRTPEGRYWITGTRSGPSQGPLYGPLVFPLNYPTAKDLAEGKGGEGIWIHGVEAGKRPSFTRGCVALSNDDVMALADFADLGTPVVILPDSVSPDPAKQLDETGMEREYPALLAEFGGRPGSGLERRKAALAEGKVFLAKEARDFPPESRMAVQPTDRDAILARLNKWRGDWSRRDTTAYEGNYSAGFKDRMGRSRIDFMERKRKIFASKRRITMELQAPEIKLEGYGRVSVTFRQEYEAEGAEPGEGVQKSSGPKTVWLEQGLDGWYIVKE